MKRLTRVNGVLVGSLLAVPLLLAAGCSSSGNGGLSALTSSSASPTASSPSPTPTPTPDTDPHSRPDAGAPSAATTTAC